MKISNTNCMNYNIHKSNTQNFNGLWRKTSKRTDIDDVLYVPQTTIIKYYCPFLDESPNDIRRILEERQNARIVVTERGHTRYFVNECKLCSKIPFTQRQYEDYMCLDDDYKDNKLITELHSFVKDKYVNEDVDEEQVPAYNPVVEDRMLDDLA